jgi:hypothetical protein
MWNFLKKLFKNILGTLAFGVGLLLLPVSYLYDKITGKSKEEEPKKDRQVSIEVDVSNLTKTEEGSKVNIFPQLQSESKLGSKSESKLESKLEYKLGVKPSNSSSLNLKN